MFIGGYNIDFMCNLDDKNLEIDERLATLRFICNNNTHIHIDTEKCKVCTTRECLNCCPADVYKYNEENKTIEVEYENCLECGTCRICCPHGAIKWDSPKGETGVRYRFG